MVQSKKSALNKEKTMTIATFILSKLNRAVKWNTIANPLITQYFQQVVVGQNVDADYLGASD